MADTSNWTAWVNLQPPGPKSLHVKGTVEAPTPGYKAELKVASPQGTNPTDLIFDLTLTSLGGTSLQVITPIPAIYVDQKYEGNHKSVSIRQDGNIIGRAEIQEVS